MVKQQISKHTKWILLKKKDNLILKWGEKKLPFALEDVAYVSFGDEMIVALEPVVAMLPYKSRVMAGFDRAHMVDHSKQRIPKKN